MARKIVEEKENIVETGNNVVREDISETKELSFSKQAFLSSKTYKPHRDLLENILEDGKNYTKKEADKLIDNYLKGKVM